MRTVHLSKEATARRNTAFLAAEHDREVSTYDAEVEYSETVTKLRERYEADMAEAAELRLIHVRPAHCAYNAAVVAAERGKVVAP